MWIGTKTATRAVFNCKEMKYCPAAGHYSKNYV